MQARILNNKMLKDLDSINKSMNVSSKELQSEINCFRQKFSKHETSVSSSGSEAADVRMFETHNPGFCFHRDGQYKKQSSPVQLSTQWFIMNVYPYIFTDGEIDPEKLICLHLLTIHTLEIPCTTKSKRIISHTVSKAIPVYEKLDYESSMPLYALESHFAANKKKREHVKKIKLINRNIVLLVGMIMNILSDINVKKYLTIIDMADDRERLVQTLSRPAMKKVFQVLENAPTLTDLKNYALISKSATCCQKQLFKLTLPLKCFNAEYLVGQIRFKLFKELKCQYRSIDISENVIANKMRKQTKVRSSDKCQQKPNIIQLLNIASRKSTDQSLTNENKLDNVMSIVLKNMSNSQRLRIGMRVAQLKEKQTILGNIGIKIHMPQVMQDVLSSRSIENLLAASFCETSKDRFKLFAHYSSLDELDLFNQDSKRSEDQENMKENKNLSQMYLQPSDHLMENKSCILFATIRQDIVNKETEKRLSRFISKQFSQSECVNIL